MAIAREDLVSALTEKGFREETDRSHDYYWLYIDGITQAINTHVSRGTKYKTLGDDLVRDISIQLKLTKPQLRDLVNCPLTGEGYVQALLARGVKLTFPPPAKP